MADYRSGTTNPKNMVGEDDLSKIIDAADSINAFCEAFERNLKRSQDCCLISMQGEKTSPSKRFSIG